MKTILHWLNEALASKDLVTHMSYYRVQNKMISATDGRITAAHPWPFDGGEFLVPGDEFEKILARLPDTPVIVELERGIKLKSGRLSGSIQTMPLTDWNYPGIEDANWLPIPIKLLPLLKALRPFISDNAVQSWATCVALENGWAFATNNIAIAGAPCAGLENIKALLPSWTIDFVLSRIDRLTHWAWTDHYVAFGWDNGAWMRSQLIVGNFPEKAATMVKTSWDEQPTQEITNEFRSTFADVVTLAEDTIEIHAGYIQSKFGKAEIQGDVGCEIPEGSDCSIWGASFLVPALAAATRWSPSIWPKPAPFKGDMVSGYVVGRKM